MFCSLHLYTEISAICIKGINGDGIYIYFSVSHECTDPAGFLSGQSGPDRGPPLQKTGSAKGSSFCDPVYFIRGYSGYMAVYTGYGRVFRGFYTGNLSGGDRVGPGNEAYLSCQVGQRLCNSGSDSIFVRNLSGADRIFPDWEL